MTRDCENMVSKISLFSIIEKVYSIVQFYPNSPEIQLFVDYFTVFNIILNTVAKSTLMTVCKCPAYDMIWKYFS